MKTAEELLKENRITPETAHHNYAYLYRAVCEVIEQAQKEVYNQAIEDAAENVIMKLLNGIIVIDKDSILKLKK